MKKINYHIFLFLLTIIAVSGFVGIRTLFAQTAAEQTTTAVKNVTVKATVTAPAYSIGYVSPTTVTVGKENTFSAKTDIPLTVKPSCFFIPNTNFPNDGIPKDPIVPDSNGVLTAFYTYVTKGTFPAMFACEISVAATATTTATTTTIKGPEIEIEVTNLISGLISAVFDTVRDVFTAEERPAAEELKETDACIFQNSTTTQKCYDESGKFSCSGITDCVIAVSGKEGAALAWKSSCGGYAESTIDGKDEKLVFDCRPAQEGRVEEPVATTQEQEPTAQRPATPTAPKLDCGKILKNRQDLLKSVSNNKPLSQVVQNTIFKCLRQGIRGEAKATTVRPAAKNLLQQVKEGVKVFWHGDLKL
jgi:hypothetical protein